MSAAETGRERKKMAAKESIVMAAQKYFSQKGFAQTSVSEIMSAANLATGTFYNYFKSKEELLSFIIEDKLSDVKLYIEESAGTPAPAYDKLTKILLAAGKVFEESKLLAVAFFQQAQADRLMPASAGPGPFLDQMLPELVRKGQAEGELNPSIPPQVVVEVLYSLLESAVFSPNTGMTLTENLSYKLLLLLQGIRFQDGEQPF